MNGVQDFIQTVQRMQWSDYLDIFVVAFVIYSLLPHLKSPSIKRIVRTVGALVLVTWLTDLLQMHTFNWILSQLLTVGLVAFVVLFQPELRYMLDHLGAMKIGSFFGYTKPVQQMEHVIAQTVSACKVMSKEKCGALIVFEKNISLDGYIREGVIIDGQVTKQLLHTIFFLNTELHDKAVIIQNGRLAAARCKLPEAKKMTSPILKELGTRHNAAVGMSQETDAVVVVVSEQTGTISVAIGGVLKRPLTVEALDQLLHNELCPAETKSKSRMEQLLDRLAGFKKEAEKE